MYWPPALVPVVLRERIYAVIAIASPRRLPKTASARRQTVGTRPATVSGRGLTPAEKRRKTILARKRAALFERAIEYIGGDVFL